MTHTHTHTHPFHTGYPVRRSGTLPLPLGVVWAGAGWAGWASFAGVAEVLELHHVPAVEPPGGADHRELQQPVRELGGPRQAK